MAGKTKSKQTSKEAYKCTSSIDIDEYTNNNLYNYVAQSRTEECMKSEKCWVGIDEAGRGPVLGKKV